MLKGPQRAFLTETVSCEHSAAGGSAGNHLRSRRNAMEQIWHLPAAAMWGFLLSLAYQRVSSDFRALCFHLG